MSDLVNVLLKQFGGDALNMITKQIGAQDSNQTQNLMQTALPVLMKALARNTAQPEGINSLAGALDRDHDGSILDNLGGFLSNFQQGGEGAGILKHLLGPQRGTVENALSQQSGLSGQGVGSMLEMLAPMVLGMLSKQRQQSQLDNNGLASLIQQSNQQAQPKDAAGLDLLTSLLDRDGDGSVMDDIGGMIGGMLGKK